MRRLERRAGKSVARSERIRGAGGRANGANGGRGVIGFIVGRNRVP